MEYKLQKMSQQYHADAFLALLAYEQTARIERIRAWPTCQEEGPFLGVRAFRKRDNLVVCTRTLQGDDECWCEVDLRNVRLMDITALKDKERFATRQIWTCDTANLDAFVRILELSGFVRMANCSI